MTRAPSKTSFLVVLTILGVACGSAPDPNTAQNSAATSSASAGGSTAAASRDACSLITADEAAKILGSAVTVTPRSMSAERSVCDYVTQAFESFALEVTWTGAEEAIKTLRSSSAAATTAAGGKADQIVNEVMGLQRVGNLGDEAYFSRRAMSYVRKGGVLLAFQNAGLNEPAREHWEALARAALARL